MRFFTTAVGLGALVAASPVAAFSISAQSLGAGGFQDSSCQTAFDCSTALSMVEAGNLIADAFGNSVDGHALTDGATGSLSGYMKVRIDDYPAHSSTSVTNFRTEKQWKSLASDTIQNFQLDPGATELVVRLQVSAEDLSDLAVAPSEFFDNGYAHSHVQAQLTYTNKNSHTAGLGQIQAVGRADRNVPLDWMEVFGGDTSPPGYGSASGGDASAMVELHIPASEVDGSDTLLVSGQLYGEVRGGYWSGAFAASELLGRHEPPDPQRRRVAAESGLPVRSRARCIAAR